MKNKELRWAVFTLLRRVDELESDNNNLILRSKKHDVIIEDNEKLSIENTSLKIENHRLKYGKVGVKTENFVPKLYTMHDRDKNY